MGKHLYSDHVPICPGQAKEAAVASAAGTVGKPRASPATEAKGFQCNCRWLTRGGHLVCTYKSTSDLRREGSRIPLRGWRPGICSCSWIWSRRRWISRRCISMILAVSSCSFSRMVGVMLGMASLGTERDRAGLMWAHHWTAMELF